MFDSKFRALINERRTRWYRVWLVWPPLDLICFLAKPWKQSSLIHVYFVISEVIMVLGASFEFDKSHNSEIVERPSDNEEVPPVREPVLFPKA